MPFTLFSHQGPLLLVKRGRAPYLSNFWLILGTIIPDFELPFRENFHNIGFYEFYWGHSLIGQLFWTVPVSIIIGIFIIAFINIFSNIITNNLLFKRFIDDLELDIPFTKHGIFIAFVSSFLGGITHVILDSFTHDSSLMFYPFLVINYNVQVLFTIYVINKTYFITIMDILWFITSTMLGLLSILCLVKYFMNMKDSISKIESKT